MNYNVVLFCTLLQLGTIFSLKAQSFDGYALYNAQNSNTAYLIDKDANIAYSWSCPAPANYAIALKDNGNIVRGVRYPSNALNGAAIGGMVHEIDSNNQVFGSLFILLPLIARITISVLCLTAMFC